MKKELEIEKSKGTAITFESHQDFKKAIEYGSTDKKDGNYTFTKKVSAQEFGGETIYTRKEYLASLDDSLAYEESKERDWFAILQDELYLIEAEGAFFAKEAFQNAYVRESYNKSIKEMSNQLLKEIEKEQDIHNATMQIIVKDILPRVEMKKFARDTVNQCPKIKSQIQENDKKNLRFYI